jgi:hypothetical protein
MNRIVVRLAVSLGCFLAIASPAFASPFDGMTLTVSRTPVPESVNLVWTGGQPIFRVYRSATRQGVTDPVNLIGTTDIRTSANGAGVERRLAAGVPEVHGEPVGAGQGERI